MPESEFSFIRWLSGVLPSTRPETALGVGDDAAVLRVGQELIAVTTDMVVENIDFQVEKATPSQIGRKALAVSLSDAAAMGLKPRWAFLAAGLRRDLPPSFARSMVEGALEIAREFDVELAGGDFSASANVTATSTVIAPAAGLKPIPRSGALPGDAILVTGELGGSLLGKHLTFSPRVKEALILNEQFEIHSMIDISDGLALDLSHIAEASGTGAVIEEDAIPISAAAVQSAKIKGVTPLQCALSDGEDFELLFTLSEEESLRLLSRAPFETRLTRIGRIEERDLKILRRDGKLIPLEIKGYEHFKTD